MAYSLFRSEGIICYLKPASILVPQIWEVINFDLWSNEISVLKWQTKTDIPPKNVFVCLFSVHNMRSLSRHNVRKIST